MGLILSVPPAQEPLDLDTAKARLRIDGDDDDEMIMALITAARMMAEQILNRPLITQTWVYKLDEWPDGDLVLPKPPVQSVTSISYLDAAGDSQVWDSANYDVFLDDWEPRIAPVYGGTWPTALAQNDAIAITYVAGYGNTGLAVPAPIMQAMLLMVDKLYAGDCEKAGDGPGVNAPMALLSLYRLLPV